MGTFEQKLAAHYRQVLGTDNSLRQPKSNTETSTTTFRFAFGQGDDYTKSGLASMDKLFGEHNALNPRQDQLEGLGLSVNRFKALYDQNTDNTINKEEVRQISGC